MEYLRQWKTRLTGMYDRYDTAIWVRAWGTALTSLTGFMLRPFLVLYLYEKMGGSILIPMIVVGLQPLTGILLSLWGGGLSDRYGRKPVMLAAQLIQTCSMFGFMFAEEVWHFAFITVLNGLGQALFSPAANAQVTDVVPQEQRAEVFALLHTALNVGAAAGPLLGLVLFTQNPVLVFGISAAAMLIYAVILWWKVPETLPSSPEAKKQQEKAPRLVIREHAPLFWMTLLAVPISMLYAQVETVFPLHLKERFDHYQTIFAWLMTINGTTVIFLQMWIARRSEHIASSKVILFAYVTLMVVALGYGFAPSFALLVAVEMLFTVGEMLVGPHMQKAVSLIAPPEMRGRYFSVYGLNWQISRGIGPVLGGLAFAQWGGEGTFAIVAIMMILAGLLQYRMIQRVERKWEQGNMNMSPIAR
ncbi:MDR family MFS transporter [Brevibacillus migulae]|uniref:MDR family MFS transporter n=1 Tax=Brevibacillus migulae TaxID=1644114 RepID=UPI001F1FD10C|nr:MFS transporter [Brevibacillus migulae]